MLVQPPRSTDERRAVSVVVPLYQRRDLASLPCVDPTTVVRRLSAVVDDGSSDDGPTIAEEAARKDTRVRVLRRPNGGLVRENTDFERPRVR
jgi:CDP-glycerol glycerophosphotransferase